MYLQVKYKLMHEYGLGHYLLQGMDKKKKGNNAVAGVHCARKQDERILTAV